MRRRLLIGVTAGAALLIGAVPNAAAADDIPDAVTSVTTSGDAKVGDVFTLDAEWAVPDGSKPGDTFRLALPEELSAMATSFDLTSPDGATVATAEVEDGAIVITLADYVEDHPQNVKGSFYLDVRVSDRATPGTPITVTWGDERVSVVPAPADDWTPGHVDNPTKYSWPAADGQIGWSIEVPGASSKTVVHDTPGASDIDCSTLTVVSADQSDGYPKDGGWATRNADVDCSASGFTVDLGDIEEDDLVRIAYRVDPDKGVRSVSNAYTVDSSAGSTGDEETAPAYGAGGKGSGERAEHPPAPSDNGGGEKPPAPSDNGGGEKPPAPSDNGGGETPKPSAPSDNGGGEKPSPKPKPKPVVPSTPSDNGGGEQPTSPAPSDNGGSGTTPAPSSDSGSSTPSTPSSSTTSTSTTPGASVHTGAQLRGPAGWLTGGALVLAALVIGALALGARRKGRTQR